MKQIHFFSVYLNFLNRFFFVTNLPVSTMPVGFQNLRAVGYQTDAPYVDLSDNCWAFSCPKPGAEVWKAKAHDKIIRSSRSNF